MQTKELACPNNKGLLRQLRSIQNCIKATKVIGSCVVIMSLLTLFAFHSVKADDFSKLDEAIPGDFVAQIAPVFDFDGDSCFPSAGISRSGQKNGGLKPSGSITGKCRSHNFLDLSNTFHRSTCESQNGSTYCVHFYALYFLKDDFIAGFEFPGEHRHDWEYAAIWTKDDLITHGSVSQHGSAETRSISELQLEQGHMKVVYHKDNIRTHAMRFAKENELAENPYGSFVIPTLVSWYNLTGDGLDNALMRNRLNSFDYGAANLPINNRNFLEKVNDIKPLGYPIFSKDIPAQDQEDKSKVAVALKRVTVTFKSVSSQVAGHLFEVESKKDYFSGAGDPKISFTFDNFPTSEILDISVTACCRSIAKKLVHRIRGAELRSGDYSGKIIGRTGIPPRCNGAPSNEPICERKEYDLSEIHYQITVEDHEPTVPEDKPQLNYATYLGSEGYDGGILDISERFLDMAIDDAGNIYLTGWTSDILSGTTSSCVGGSDAFVTKINADGTHDYSTCLSGNGGDGGLGIAVDKAGNAYVVGATQAVDFPIPNGLDSFDRSYNGGRGEHFYGDAFIAKLDANGVLITASYLGGTGVDVARAIAIDDNGNVYVTGEMESFEPMSGVPGYDVEHNGLTDIFVAKLDADLSTFEYFTFLGTDKAEMAVDIAVDDQGSAYIIGHTHGGSAFQTEHVYGTVSGEDVLIVKLNRSGTELEYSTILAGIDNDIGYAIALNEQGNAFITGVSPSNDFPVTEQAYDKTLEGSDAFITKLDLNGERIYATFLGGTGQDIGNDITVDSRDNVYVTGISGDSFPITADNTQECPNGFQNAFFSVLDPDGSQLLHSICIGGNARTHGMAIQLDSKGMIYLAGSTWIDNFPASNGFQKNNAGYSDIFVTKWTLLSSK
ncbi:MAG: NPP1 family protein [Chloroflexota bacterium]